MLLTAFLAVLNTSKLEPKAATVVQTALDGHVGVVQSRGPLERPISLITAMLSMYSSTGRAWSRCFSPPAGTAVDGPVSVAGNDTSRRGGRGLVLDLGGDIHD